MPDEGVVVVEMNPVADRILMRTARFRAGDDGCTAFLKFE
mgnify:CR=1 FL=1